MMLKEVRQQRILQEVIKFHKVKSSELIKILKVSEDTIRRDLKELAAQGMVKKVHGGAVTNATFPANLSDKKLYYSNQRRIIANKAMNLLKPGQVILIDGSILNLEFARHFPPDLGITLFTNSVSIAYHLCDHPSVDVILLGGKMFKSASITFGTDVVSYLTEINVDISFIGTQSIHPKLGITTDHREEALIKKKIVEVSQRIISMVTSDKIGQVCPFNALTTDHINTLITELSPDHPLLSPFRKKGLEII